MIFIIFLTLSYLFNIELNEMAREISADLKEGRGDVEYWESVLKECKLASARARLHEVHLSMLAHRLETLRKNKLRKFFHFIRTSCDE